MNTNDVSKTMVTLLSELIQGSGKSGGYMLNGGDQGLLRSLDSLSAAAASATHGGGASIAAHVDHLQYGLSLMNRWGGGEDPFSGADWGASWRKTTVTEAQWEQLRAALRQEALGWLDIVGKPRDVDEQGLNGMMGSIAHLAYHMGAIRQIDRAARGPLDSE